MKLKMVYLAGPIDLVNNSERKNWRQQAGEILEKEGIGAFSPYHAFTGKIDTEKAKQVISINTAALNACDAMILNLPEGIQTIGSIFELYEAKIQGKPIVIVTNIIKALYLQEFLRFTDLQSAIDFLIYELVEGFTFIVKR